MPEDNGTLRSFAFTPPPRVVVPIVDSAKLFPVRRVYCVGRNYKAHIKEMGGDERESPFFFQKPTDAIVSSGTSIPYPPGTADLQHEVELVVAIGGTRRDLDSASAGAGVFGVAVGIDLTRRDLQIAARQAGRPWEAGKSFDQSAPVSPIRRLCGEMLKQGRIQLLVNGTIRQDSDLCEMIWNVAEITSHLSKSFSLAPGDLIFTGTPSGVGPLAPGDVIEAAIEGVGRLTVSIAN
jgi:fumarylpyruvate hydrolase